LRIKHSYQAELPALCLPFYREHAAITFSVFGAFSPIIPV
jgi:hypothetical protein